MKTKFFLSFALIAVLAALLIGCTEQVTETTPANECAKCGGEATQTVSGTDKDMENLGIPVNNRKRITSNIYRAYLCDSCVGPVVELKP